ncbi:hypothetical protein M0R45_006654 [Rubus argutus]|uniref:MHC class II antigen n=1 Tax=Rubus argutus TaxID=59490 RepID=A0AAW1YR60_RUBAR
MGSGRRGLGGSPAGQGSCGGGDWARRWQRDGMVADERIGAAVVIDEVVVFGCTAEGVGMAGLGGGEDWVSVEIDWVH